MGKKAAELTNRLRVARAEHGFSQAQLASLAGVTRQTIGSIEKNEYCPSTVLALRLAKVLDATVEELFQLVEE